jgi:hypothetical protein
MQLYSGLVFSIVKGAGHTVPASKRPEALHLFNNTLSGHADIIREQKEKKE